MNFRMDKGQRKLDTKTALDIIAEIKPEHEIIINTDFGRLMIHGISEGNSYFSIAEPISVYQYKLMLNRQPEFIGEYLRHLPIEILPERIAKVDPDMIIFESIRENEDSYIKRFQARWTMAAAIGFHLLDDSVTEIDIDSFLTSLMYEFSISDTEYDLTVSYYDSIFGNFESKLNNVTVRLIKYLIFETFDGRSKVAEDNIKKVMNGFRPYNNCDVSKVTHNELLLAYLYKRNMSK